MVLWKQMHCFWSLGRDINTAKHSIQVQFRKYLLAWQNSNIDTKYKRKPNANESKWNLARLLIKLNMVYLEIISIAFPMHLKIILVLKRKCAREKKNRCHFRRMKTVATVTKLLGKQISGKIKIVISECEASLLPQGRLFMIW